MGTAGKQGRKGEGCPLFRTLTGPWREDLDWDMAFLTHGF